MKRLSDMVEKRRLENVDYAATFWAQHLADVMPISLVADALGDQGEVITFFRAKLLEWFKCLRLLDQLPRAIEALRMLADTTSPNSSMSALVQDAKRFLLRHYYTIATWPLQIYSSAIFFGSQTSIVKVANLGKLPRWLKALPKVEMTWASLVQTLRDHSISVTAVAFSPDGKHIASRSYDMTVKLWDATTGDYKKTLKGHSSWYRFQREIKTSRVITSVRYSEDGEKIVTDTGVFPVNNVVSDAEGHNYRPLQRLWVDDMWLCNGTIHLLRLASDSEPDCHDTNNDQAVVGMSSGHILVFDNYRPGKFR